MGQIDRKGGRGNFNSATALYSWSDKPFFFGLQIILTNGIEFRLFNSLVGDYFTETFFVLTRPLRKPKSETPFPCRAPTPLEGCRSQRPRRRLLQLQNQRDNTRGEYEESLILAIHHGNKAVLRRSWRSFSGDWRFWRVSKNPQKK